MKPRYRWNAAAGWWLMSVDDWSNLWGKMMPACLCEQCFGKRYTSDGLPCTACNAMDEARATLTVSGDR